MRQTKPLIQIERLLVEAVRKVEGCEKFRRVIAEVLLPYSVIQDEANWRVGFVDYGPANHMKCNEALAQAVKALQAQFDAT